MCDACDSTLFNFHWACQKCGFAVCTQCYSERMLEESKKAGKEDEDSTVPSRDWLTCCANRQSHDLESLMITQIIPSDGKTNIFFIRICLYVILCNFQNRQQTGLGHALSKNERHMYIYILELKAHCCSHKMGSSLYLLDWWTTGLRNAAQILILWIYNSLYRCITCILLNYSILGKPWILLYSFAVVFPLTRDVFYSQSQPVFMN